MSKRVELFGVTFDNLTLEESVQAILSFSDMENPNGSSHYISTPNVQFLTTMHGFGFRADSYSQLQEVVRDSSLVVADGMPIVWMSRLLGDPLKERVCGSDLLPALARRAAQKGKNLYFLGGAGEDAHEAAALLQKELPGLNVVGVASPQIAFPENLGGEISIENETIVDTINQSGAHLLFLGLGCPKQELWFQHVKRKLEVPVVLGIGGSFAFITGRVKRAPPILGQLGLEWIYRIIQDPKRLWKRYFVDLFRFMGLVVSQLLQRGRRGRAE